jgi:hypothetical protein
MDMQGGFSFSIPISYIPRHPKFQKNVGRLWTNAQFQKKIWECNQKPFKEANWKDFIKKLNAHFSHVHWSGSKCVTSGVK